MHSQTHKDLRTFVLVVALTHGNITSRICDLQQIMQLFLTLFDIKRLLSATKSRTPANTRDCSKTTKTHKTTNKQ